MSILSCESFYSNSGEGIEIKEENNAIEITLLPQGSGRHSTSTSTDTTSGGTVNPYRFTAGDRVDVANVANNYVVNVTGTFSTSGWTQFRTTGFRFFFKEGYLRCLRKEISDYAVYSNSSGGTVNLPINNAPGVRNCIVFPYEVLNHIFTEDHLKTVKEKVMAFAGRKGTLVPEKFSAQGPGESARRSLGRSLRSVLDWLSIPLVREVDSAAFSFNLTPADRGLISPLQVPMNFKQLVRHYYGTTTSKMLQEIWNKLTIGDEFKKTVFQLSPEQFTGVLHYTVSTVDTVLETNNEYMIQIGSRMLNVRVFNVGPAVFKKMGFDWLYEWLKKDRDERDHDSTVNRDSTLHASGSIEQDIALLLRYISPRKMVSILCGHDIHYGADVARMLGDYSDGSEVPAPLRSQFPNGLEVNFKFKTMKELHDKISTQYTIIETEATKKPIPTHPAYLALNGREKDGLRLVVPEDTSALAIWGKLLNICVASYGDRAARADTLILGVEKNGEIKYCLEFSPVIMQMIKREQMIGRGLLEENSPTAIEEPTIRVALPALQEKHMGVTPTDVKEDTFLTPYIVQFRSSRNGNPEKEDENAVTVMLSNWVEEFKTYYDELGDKAFYKRNSWDYNNAVHRWNVHAEQGGIADQLIINPRQYQQLQQAFAPPIPDGYVREEDAVDAIRYHVEVAQDVIQNDDIGPLMEEQNPARFQEIANEVLNGLNARLQDAIVGVDFAANAEI